MTDQQSGSSEIKQMYRKILGDNFPQRMVISFDDGAPESAQHLVYHKVGWEIAGEVKGLRYGDNPGQEAALYRLVNGNLAFGDVKTIQPGRYLVSDAELLQSGKHPGKTNITDVDSALGILRYIPEKCVVITKHNNPCGAATDYDGTKSLAEVYHGAHMADRIAAFGGAITVNRAIDKTTADLIAESYTEVVAAPEFEEGVMDIFAKKKNLRVMRIGNIARLQEYAGDIVPEFRALADGGQLVQFSFVPQTRTMEAIKALKEKYHVTAKYKDKEYKINREPTEKEYQDMLFGWLVESGVMSNSVLYVKDGVTVAIGAGGQDRFGMAQFARDKAHRNLADRLCWERHGVPYVNLADNKFKTKIDDEVKTKHGGLEGAVMVSDAFFPFRDGIDVGLNEGVSAVIQPGGSDRDFESIEACNERNAAMVFTGQRSFKH